MKKTHIERRKSLLKDEISKQSKEKANELIHVDTPNIWKHFKDKVLRSCGEISAKNKCRSKGANGCGMDR